MAAKKKTVSKGLNRLRLETLLKNLSKARKESEKAEQVAKAKRKQKDELQLAVMAKLKDLKLDRATGAGLTVSAGELEIVEEVNWPEFYKYIQRTKGYDLLQKRPSISAIRERRDAGKKVAGVKLGKVPKLNVTTSKRAKV